MNIIKITVSLDKNGWRPRVKLLEGAKKTEKTIHWPGNRVDIREWQTVSNGWMRERPGFYERHTFCLQEDELIYSQMVVDSIKASMEDHKAEVDAAYTHSLTL